MKQKTIRLVVFDSGMSATKKILFYFFVTIIFRTFTP